MDLITNRQGVQIQIQRLSKITRKSLMKTTRSDSLIHMDFLSIISMSLLCCYKKMFSHMKTSMIRKNLVKHHYMREEIFKVT